MAERISSPMAAMAADRRWSGRGRGLLGGDQRRFWIPAFLAPFLILYAAFTLWPLIATGLYSLFDWDGIEPLNRFVGLANYTRAMSDPIFWLAFGNTLLFALLNTAIKLPLTFLAAVLLTQRWLWFKRLFRTIFFLPLILPVAAAGLVFTYLLNPSNGALDGLLVGSGLLKQPIDLLGHDNTALLTIVAVSVWQIFGQYLIYWMAALQGVPEEIYEAARIDGAGPWRQMIAITLPMIRPVALIITLLALVNSLHVFGIVVTLTGGRPGQATYVVSYYIYNEAFRQAPFDYGYASAVSLLFGALSFLLVVVQGYLARSAGRLRRDYGL